MTATEYLSQYKKLNDYAERMKECYLAAREKAGSIPSSLGNAGEIRGSSGTNYAEEKILKLDAAREAYADAAYDALLLRHDIFSFIWDIPGLDGQVLIERYLNLKTWQQIQVDLGKAPNTLYRAHRRGLEIVQERLDKLDQVIA